MKITANLVSAKNPVSGLLILGLFEGEKRAHAALQKLDASAAQLIEKAILNKRFEGKEGETLPVFGTNAFHAAGDLLVVGLGKKDAFESEKLRKLVGNLYARAKSQKSKTVGLILESFVSSKLKLDQIATLVPETLRLAEYRFDRYKEKKKDVPEGKVEESCLFYSDKKDAKIIEQKLKHSEIVSSAVNYTRDLINEPANVMNPRVFAGRAKEIAEKGKLKIKVLELDEIKRLGMSGVIAVSKGSEEPPRFVVIEYGVSHKNQGTICLVGKGVCFDSGGISIKPSKDMEKMKYDMAGAAAVLGTMKALAELKPSVHVVGITPLVENMPSGTASRPGDIITYTNGKSVEIINTDAEGRLILADALIYASKLKPKAIVDLATLTGACAVALADRCAGVMTNNSNLTKKLISAGEEVGERLWELPMWADYLDIIKGHHSDLLNAGSGYGGTITAAKFLEQFVDCKSWAHLDIAGVAWCDSPKSYNVKGATGFGVRLLCQLISNWK